MTIDWTAYKKRMEDAARTGLVDYAPTFSAAAESKARDTFPGQTGATFASVYATVSGAPESFAVEQAAIQEALLLNPLHVKTTTAQEPRKGVIRMWGTNPLEYLSELEADPTHAFLARTFDEEQGNIKAAVDKAVGGAT